jgi:hypothetical protein
MTIKVGDKVPSVKLKHMTAEGVTKPEHIFGCFRGCRAGNSRVTNPVVSRTPLESGAIERDSRVGENDSETRVKLGPEIVGREAIATAAGSGAGDLVALTNLRRPFSRTTSQRGFPILQKDGRKDRSLGGEFIFRQGLL